MKDSIGIFKRYLKSRGKNVTQAREQIAAEVFRTKGHLTATGLWASLGTNIAISTIYRTLELLADAGLIRQVDIGSDQATYELVLGQRHHEHMVCTLCGKVIEFSNEKLEEEIADVADRYNFLHHSHNLRIFGICQDCQKQEDLN
jgi:Fur family ferric uptake transcriptional regulator